MSSIKMILDKIGNPFLSKLPVFVNNEKEIESDQAGSPQTAEPALSHKVPDPQPSGFGGFGQPAPVQAVVQPQKLLPALVLQGQIYDAPYPQALISKRIVSVGDEIDGARVISISSAGIVLLFEGKTYTLNMTDGLRPEN